MSSARCPTSCLRTSIPSTAVSEVSTVHASTNILDGGLETVDGNVPKLLSGKKKMLMSSPFLGKSKILFEQLKKPSSTENLGFSGDFNCTNTSRSTLCEEETINEKKIGSKRKVVTDINLLHDDHAKVLKSYSEWEQSVHARFTAGDGRTIRSMITYLVNGIRGYGRFNDEGHFKRNRARDVTGEMYRETEIGFEIWKEFL